MRNRRWRLLVALLAVIAAGACGDRSTPVQPPRPGPATTPTPPAPVPVPLTVRGIVRVVNGGPAADVVVTTNPPGAKTMTAADGSFSLENLVQPVLVFHRSGLRTTSWKHDPSLPNDALVIRMQPWLTLQRDAPLASILTEDDLTYSSEFEDSFWAGVYFCSPCKEVIVGPGNEGGVRLVLEWTGSTPLDVWAGEYYSGVVVSKVGDSGTSRIELDVPAVRRFDTVLVGVGLRNGQRQAVPGTIAFTLSIVPRD